MLDTAVRPVRPWVCPHEGLDHQDLLQLYPPNCSVAGSSNLALVGYRYQHPRAPVLWRCLCGYVSFLLFLSSLINAGFNIAWSVGITIGGSGSDYGIATGIMTLVVLLPVAKNNIFKYLFGVPFERMIKYHRWAGYYLMVPLFLHALMGMYWLLGAAEITLILFDRG